MGKVLPSVRTCSTSRARSSWATLSALSRSVRNGRTSVRATSVTSSSATTIAAPTSAASRIAAVRASAACLSTVAGIEWVVWAISSSAMSRVTCWEASSSGLPTSADAGSDNIDIRRTISERSEAA